ncbi:MAG: GDP-mannose 4,6-dehydratase [Ferruginibacter sp.]
MTVIIFGAGGQDGYYLTRLLQSMGHNVIGVSRRGHFDHSDITDYESVSKLILKHSPKYVFHMAANSTTKHEALFENHATIATGTLNILEAVKNVSPSTKVFISGSGLQFKNTGEPIKESDPFEARDAYSVSRIQSVFAARYYRTLGLQVYVGYFYNHDSPYRTERHISKKITEAVKRIANGSQEKIEIGDGSVIKEWTYAGDIVEGIMKLVLQDVIFEANISSGIGYSIEDWITTCFTIIKKDHRDHIIEKKDFKPEYNSLVSDSSVIRSLGFTPKVNFTQLAQMMINDK